MFVKFNAMHKLGPSTIGLIQVLGNLRKAKAKEN